MNAKELKKAIKRNWAWLKGDYVDSRSERAKAFENSILESIRQHKERTEKAMDLWERLLGGGYNPWQGNDYGDTFCVFCYEDYPNHTGDCVYVDATQLVGCEPITRVGY